MTDTSKDAVERLLDGVTPGPWQAESGHTQKNCQLYWQVTDGSDAIVQNQFCWCQGDHTANARFIAAARELVPALLAEREALTAEVARRSEMHECAMVERDDCILDWSDTKAERDRLAAEVARLALETTNLRQMERNVQTVREHEHKRAEAALAEVARLTTALDALSTLIHSGDVADNAAHAARREGGAE